MSRTSMPSQKPLRPCTEATSVPMLGVICIHCDLEAGCGRGSRGETVIWQHDGKAACDGDLAAGDRQRRLRAKWV
ncbi:hypothetical protein E2562_006875 [Oryza meyeriana var. granulata]|uniref:Uncharacterized protein n=1 Tax=Oryza meyeriana var. granulata TaxID=110450 RepID=A0A6G1C5V5_9ORYZ|nr:hypothetical protein E2562_006875 [Oryza meyeriana var. granulata]